MVTGRQYIWLQAAPAQQELEERGRQVWRVRLAHLHRLVRVRGDNQVTISARLLYRLLRGSAAAVAAGLLWGMGHGSWGRVLMEGFGGVGGGWGGVAGGAWLPVCVATA